MLEGPVPAVGTQVVAEIDWDRRFTLMRTHTALHALSGIVFRDYGAKVTGGSTEYPTRCSARHVGGTAGAASGGISARAGGSTALVVD